MSPPTFFCEIETFGSLGIWIISLYALVICNHGPHGAGDSGGIAGLKYGDFTFGVSRQCRGMAGLLIPAKTAGEIAGRFVWVAMIRCFFYICQHFQTSGFVLKMSLPIWILT